MQKELLRQRSQTEPRSDKGIDGQMDTVYFGVQGDEK